MEISYLKQLVELISNSGIAIVCSAVLLIFTITMFKKQQKTLDEVTKSLSRGSHPSSEDTEVLETINEKIHEEVAGVLNSLSSDRAYVYLYHNGGVSSSGLFFQRMSCICEVVDSGVLPVSSSSQNLHKGAYSNLCKALATQGQFVVDDTESLKDTDGFMYQRYQSEHTESAYVKSLNDSLGRSIGFIGVDYCSLNNLVDNDMILEVLTAVSQRVSALVDVKSVVSK